MSEDSVYLLHALWIGGFITFVYDGLIILRNVIPHKGFPEALEDLAFWIFCATYVFLWLYRESNGTLRWFAVAGALTGMLVYKKTISGLWIKGAGWLLSHILKLLGRVAYLMWKPFAFLGRQIAHIHRRWKKRRRKIRANLKIKLKSHGKALKMKLCKH